MELCDAYVFQILNVLYVYLSLFLVVYFCRRISQLLSTESWLEFTEKFHSGGLLRWQNDIFLCDLFKKVVKLFISSKKFLCYMSTCEMLVNMPVSISNRVSLTILRRSFASSICWAAARKGPPELVWGISSSSPWVTERSSHFRHNLGCLRCITPHPRLLEIQVSGKD